MKRILVGLLAGTSLLAYDPPMATGTGQVSGVFVDAETGVPVSNASINLRQTRGITDYRTTRPRSESARADGRGAFAFSGLPVGEFSVEGYADGYLSTAADQRRPAGSGLWVTLAEGAQRHVVLEAWREARIEGTVVDEHGDPLASVGVRAIDLSRDPAIAESRRGRFGALSDENGHFVIQGMFAGDYQLCLPMLRDTRREPLTRDPDPGWSMLVPPPPLPSTALTFPVEAPVGIEPPFPTRVPGALFSSFSREIRLPPKGPRGEPRTYDLSFYPGTTDPRHAAVIHVDAGQRVDGITIRAQVSASTSIAGVMTGLDQGAQSEIRLVRDEEFPGDVMIARSWLQSSGEFAFVDVPPGRYVIKGQRYYSSGHSRSITEGELTRLPIVVGESGVRDLVVPFSEGVRVRGRVLVDKDRPGPASAHIELYSMTPPEFMSRLFPARTTTQSFAVENVGHGSYVIGASGAGRSGEPARWFLKSATLRGRDVTSTPFDVDDADIDDVVVTLTDRATRIFGDVTPPITAYPTTATVVVFPASLSAWSANPLGAGPRFASMRARQDHFSFVGFPPGDYYVAAIDERAMDDWPRAWFLMELAAVATRIHAEEGAQIEVHLTVVR